MTSALPDEAAMCIGVTPLLVVLALTSAPALMSALVTAALPDLAARCSGVYWPMRVTAPMLAPA